MSGLLALLDDVAAIAKIAAAQLDDITTQAVKAGAKTAGVLIDDSAVTPKYVEGLPAARELPIVWRIARGSLFNKIVILLPAALLLSAFAPWALTPLLMLGGAYLCFEGAEKVWSLIAPHSAAHADAHGQEAAGLDAAHLEEQRVAGAIKTDFILSAEIMTLSLASLTSPSLWAQGAALALIAVGVTALVYGSVALLVRADDFGLRLAATASNEQVRGFGRGLVAAMPSVLAVIGAVGTAAMLWVGGSIVSHGLHELGLHEPYGSIHAVAEAAGGGFFGWVATATLDGLFGLVIGLALMPIVEKALLPAWRALAGQSKP